MANIEQPSKSDQVGGDSIAVGDIAGAQAVAIGRGAQAIVNITELSKSDRLDQRNRGILLGKIQDFWIDQVFVPSIRENEYILLDKEIDPHATINPLHEMQHKFSTDKHDEVLVGKTIEEVFSDLERSMLVLGDVGVGKTTSLLGLTDHFVQLAAQNLDEPMPVILNLSSWRKDLSTAAWVVRELNGIYGVPQLTTQQWLREASLLLLLDGLDELPSDLQDDCVMAINHFRDEYGLTPLAVCCRENIYHQLGVKLKMSGAIRIRPLTASQIDMYVGKQLQPLRQAIAEHDELAQMATNFLILKMMIDTTLAGRLDELLSQTTYEDRMRFLLDATQQEMLQEIGEGTDQSSLTRNDRWLAWLATRMVELQQSVFLLERMQPTWLKLRERILYTVLLTFILTPILYTLFVDILYYPDAPLPFDLIAALIVALALAIFMPIIPVQALRWSILSLRKNVLRMVALSVVVGLIFGFLLDLSYAFEEGLFDPDQLGIAAFWFAVAAVPIGAVMAGLKSEQVDRTSRPNQGIRRSGFYGVIVGVALAVFATVVLLLTYGINYAHVVAIPAGLYYGGLAFVQHFVLRGVLILFRHAPVGYVRFLDKAVDKEILRRVGGGYIFTHRSMMQHFADITTADDLVKHQGQETVSLMPSMSPLTKSASPTALAGFADTSDDFMAVGYRMTARELVLGADEDLLRQINHFIEDNSISFCTILACTGRLSHVMLRQGIQSERTGAAGRLIIGSMSGMLKQTKPPDIFIMVSDEKGQIISGMLQEGSRTLEEVHVLLCVLDQ